MLLFISRFLQVMHDHATRFLVLYPPCGVFPGDSLFSMSIDDIITTSFCFLLRLHPLGMSHPIRGFPTLTHPHACILPSGGGIPYFFLHPTFGEGNILCSQHTSTDNTSYTLTHMFKVSTYSLGTLCQLYMYIHIPHPMPPWHMCT